MATSKKAGDGEFYSRRKRGARPTKYPKGFDRWGYPTTCGVVVDAGKECPDTSFMVWGPCQRHWAERMRELGRENEVGWIVEKST